MDRSEFYRLLIADHFELLESEERPRLEQAIVEHADVDRAAFLERLRAAFDTSDDWDNEEQFLDAVAAAAEGRSLGAGVAPEAATKHRLPAWANWRLAVAGAVGAAAVWIGAMLVGPFSPSEPVNPAGQPVFLNSARSQSSDAVDLSASSAPHLTLIAEVRIEDPSVKWEFRRYQSDALTSGVVEFPADSPSLRSIAIQIPKKDLVAATYWLVLLDDSGEILRQWFIRLQ